MFSVASRDCVDLEFDEVVWSSHFVLVEFSFRPGEYVCDLRVAGGEEFPAGQLAGVFLKGEEPEL